MQPASNIKTGNKNKSYIYALDCEIMLISSHSTKITVQNHA